MKWSENLIWLMALAVSVGILSISAPDLVEEPASELIHFRQESPSRPAYFEKNQGQTLPQVEFVARFGSVQIFLSAGEVIFKLPDSVVANRFRSFRMRFPGANPRPQVLGQSPLSGRTHYLLGNDSNGWVKEVRHYAQVRYRDLYPGIDLVFYETQGQLEYDFLVAPGADPSQIQLDFFGLDDRWLGRENQLVLRVGKQRVVQRIPAVYQELGSNIQTISASHQLDANGQVRFALVDYDPSRALVIDPVLEFARFFGGSGEEEILSIATDTEGNIYVTGGTSSPNLPVTSPGLAYPANIFETKGNRLAFVAKLDSTGTRLHYLTYLGGSKTATAHYVAVDPTGSAYLAGRTEADDFPVRDPIQSVYGGGSDDVFLTKLHPNGSSIVYSTYLGGSAYDQARSLALDGSQNVYLTGRTESSNFPTRNPIQSSYGGKQDSFVVKVHRDGSHLLYSTYLGGSENDVGHAITTDSAGNAYITGLSNSPDLPTRNAFQPSFRGGEGDDAIVVKVNADGSELLYSTFVGGRDDDESRAIVVDASGNVTIAGYTRSNDFPVSNAWQSEFGGPSHDIFVTALNADGSGLRYSTFIGGSGSDYGRGLALDEAGNIYLTGYTDSGDFPTQGALQAHYAGGRGDSIVVKLNRTASAMLYSSFLGGSGFERGRAIRVDSSGSILVSGRTESTDFGVTRSSSPAFGGGADDAFLVKLRID